MGNSSQTRLYVCTHSDLQKILRISYNITSLPPPTLSGCPDFLFVHMLRQ